MLIPNAVALRAGSATKDAKEGRRIHGWLTRDLQMSEFTRLGTVWTDSNGRCRAVCALTTSFVVASNGELHKTNIKGSIFICT